MAICFKTCLLIDDNYIDNFVTRKILEGGGPTLLMIPIGIGVLALVGGFLLFDREAPWVAEQL